MRKSDSSENKCIVHTAFTNNTAQTTCFNGNSSLKSCHFLHIIINLLSVKMPQTSSFLNYYLYSSLPACEALNKSNQLLFFHILTSGLRILPVEGFSLRAWRQRQSVTSNHNRISKQFPNTWNTKHIKIFLLFS